MLLKTPIACKIELKSVTISRCVHLFKPRCNLGSQILGRIDGGIGSISAQIDDGGHSRRGGAAEELGPLGRERRNWHAQLHATRRYCRRDSPRAKRKSDF